jgi:hypothetical protein
MSSSTIIASNNKIYDTYLPNPYPYPAQANDLASVLVAGNNAGNQDIVNVNNLQCVKVDNPEALGSLTIGSLTQGALSLLGDSVALTAQNGAVALSAVSSTLTATSAGLMTLQGNAGLTLNASGAPLNISCAGSVLQCNASSGIGFATTTGDISLLPSAGSVGCGTVTPNVNAILDCTSVTKAFLPPRMTTVQKNAIAGPTAGMVVYDSTLNKLCVRGASAWETITSV